LRCRDESRGAIEPATVQGEGRQSSASMRRGTHPQRAAWPNRSSCIRRFRLFHAGRPAARDNASAACLPTCRGAGSLPAQPTCRMASAQWRQEPIALRSNQPSASLFRTWIDQRQSMADARRREWVPGIAGPHSRTEDQVSAIAILAVAGIAAAPRIALARVATAVFRRGRSQLLIGHVLSLLVLAPSERIGL